MLKGGRVDFKLDEGVISFGTEEEFRTIAQASPLVTEPFPQFIVHEGIEHTVGAEERGKFFAQEKRGVDGIGVDNFLLDTEEASFLRLGVHDTAEDGNAGGGEGEDVFFPKLPPAAFLERGLHRSVERHERADIHPGEGKT